MLDPWIIEEIRRREEEETRERERAVLEISMEMPVHRPEGDAAAPKEERGERGVTIVDFSI